MSNRNFQSHKNIMHISSSISSTSKHINTNTYSIRDKLKILYKFSRPHTIKGTILASFMGVSRALIENRQTISWSLIPKAVVGLIALLAGNAYIVGLNQIYDVKIDEINKPFLPIAAKNLSPERAWQIITVCLITGISIVKTQFSSLIFGLYMLGVVLGTLYSVPPIQLKGVPILAGSIIAFVRGFLLNFGVYYAVREALSVKFTWNPVVTFISTFMTVFASVIAITKDLSDIEGDKKYNIDTFAAKYGVRTIANASATLLCTAYITAVLLPFLPALLPLTCIPGFLRPLLVQGKVFNVLPMSLGHLSLLSYFMWSFRQLDAEDMKSIKKFYKVIWNLFYLEYCLYPFI